MLSGQERGVAIVVAVRRLRAHVERHAWRDLVVALVVLATIGVFCWRVPAAEHEVRRIYRHLTIRGLRWIPVAVTLEALAFAAGGVMQWRLLAATGHRMRIRAAVALGLAASGLTTVLPGGVVPAGGWLVDQYRRRGVGQDAGLWVVAASGLFQAVAAIGLLLVGLGVADLVAPPLLVLAGIALAGGSMAFVRGVHRLPELESRAHRRGWNRHVVRVLHRFASGDADVAKWRAGWFTAAASLVLSALTVVLGAGSVATAFAVLGFHIPWSSLLFAFAVSQVVATIVPMPGGIGVMAGGLVGALNLTGTPLGQAVLVALVYRFLSHWVMTAIATLGLVLISHRSRESALARRIAEARAARRAADAGPLAAEVAAEAYPAS